MLFINSFYGRVLKVIREDEIVVESMGISFFKYKVIGFVIGVFFVGVGGGLFGNLMGIIDFNMFKFSFIFNIFFIIVIGGMGSVIGIVILVFIVIIFGEVLRFLDMEK